MSTENPHKSLLPDNAVIKERKPVLFWRLVVFFGLTCLVSLVFSAVSSADEGKRSALIIGIDAYEEVPKLAKAKNDATAIADALDTLGFDVHLHLDVTRRQLYRALTDFTATLGSNDEALFYFAGHGVESSGRNYLLPADVPKIRPGQEILLSASSLPVDDVINALDGKETRVATLILDACRDNPFPREGTRSLGGTRGLTAVNVPKGTFILYSAGLGQAALDRLSDEDPDPNSVFTRALLPRIVEPGLSIRDLAVQVRSEVESLAAMVGHQQRPAYYDEISGAFSFAPKPIVNELPAEDESNQGSAEEQVEMSVCNSARADWPLVKESNSVRAVEEFVTLYEQCSVITILAEEHLERLMRKRRKAEADSPIGLGPSPEDLGVQGEGINERVGQSGEPNRLALTIKPDPSDARVRIMNIAPPYEDGIELEPGSYEIEVAAPDYVTHRQWYRLEGNDLVVDVQLSAKDEVRTSGDAEKTVDNRDEKSSRESSEALGMESNPSVDKELEEKPLHLSAKQPTDLWDGVGPENSRRVQSVIATGTRIKYIGHGFSEEFGMWARVETPNGLTGFVSVYQLLDVQLESFDGEWYGSMECTQVRAAWHRLRPGSGALSLDVRLQIKEARVKLWGDKGSSDHPQGGSIALSDGVLSKRGQITISGTAIYDNTGRTSYRYSGNYADGSFSLGGTRGSRRCSILVHKTEIPSAQDLEKGDEVGFFKVLRNAGINYE